MKNSIKKAVVAIAFSATMFLSMNTASAAPLEWVRDAYPNQWDYVLVKEKNGEYYTQVWTSSDKFFLVKCELISNGKCFVSK
ncbi:hypothetical protein [Bacillus safensis]|uniref:hypothetical protein n=1 Tax=Bacillus safensis TaxID=561879 RepID=UPI0021C906C7|nr:hypothetical protein [Bacillus safensis]MCU0155141.1 hypothetical protein [Bacillus safensis]